VAPVGGWSGGERERGKLQKQGQWELVFCWIWTWFSPPSGHQLSLYL
jgi:hypothetical protein